MTQVVRVIFAIFLASTIVLSGCKSSSSGSSSNGDVIAPEDGNGNNNGGNNGNGDGDDNDGNNGDGDNNGNGEGNDGDDGRNDLVDGPDIGTALNPGYEYGKGGRPESLLAAVRAVNNTVEREMNKELQEHFGSVRYERGKENEQGSKLKNVRGDDHKNSKVHLFAQRGFEGIEVFPTQAMCLVELYNTESHIQDILLGWKHENGDPTGALESALQKGLLSQLLLYTEQVVAAAAEPFSFQHNLQRTSCNLGQAPNQYPVQLPDLNAVDEQQNSFIYNYGSRSGDDYDRSANLLKGALGSALEAIRDDIDALQATIFLAEKGGSFDPDNVTASIDALQEKLEQFLQNGRVTALAHAIKGKSANGTEIGTKLDTQQEQVSLAAMLIHESIERVAAFLAEQIKPNVDGMVADNSSAQLSDMFETLALENWIFHKDSKAKGQLGSRDTSGKKAKELADDIQQTIKDIQNRTDGSTQSKSTFFGNDIESTKIDASKVTQEMKKLASLQDGDADGMLNTWLANFETLIGSFHWLLLVLLVSMGVLRHRNAALSNN